MPHDMKNLEARNTTNAKPWRHYAQTKKPRSRDVGHPIGTRRWTLTGYGRNRQEECIKSWPLKPDGYICLPSWPWFQVLRASFAFSAIHLIGGTEAPPRDQRTSAPASLADRRASEPKKVLFEQHRTRKEG